MFFICFYISYVNMLFEVESTEDAHVGLARQ